MQNLLKLWYIVYTRPKAEYRVMEVFTRRKMECYLPVTKPRRQSIDMRKSGAEPLFNAYVFVRLHESQLMQIAETEEVIGFVYWLGQPVIVDEEEIGQLKKFLNDFSDVRLEKTVVNQNPRVRVFDGLLVKNDANFVEIIRNTIRLSLPSIGYALVSHIKQEVYEKLSV